MIELDGSEGEGGGQILRSALALSILTGRPFKLVNIRANRSKPGLQPQHLMCVRAAGTISGATYKGAAIGSSVLYFEPEKTKPGRYTFTIGTAGATALLLHTVYLPLALRGTGPSTVSITGGTHNTHAPCFHFLDTTWRAHLEQLGLHIRMKLIRPGFYPRGGGVVTAHVQPCASLGGFRWAETPPVHKAAVLSAVAGLPEDIAKRQARRASYRLQKEGIAADVREESWEGGPGTVCAVTLPTTPVPAAHGPTRSVPDGGPDGSRRARAPPRARPPGRCLPPRRPAPGPAPPAP